MTISGVIQNSESIFPLFAQKYVGLSGLTEGSSRKIASQLLSAHCCVSLLSLVHWTTLPQHESNLCVASQDWHTLVHWGWHSWGHGIWGSDCWAEHWSLTWYSWLCVQCLSPLVGSKTSFMAIRIANFIQCVRSLYRTELCQDTGIWASFTHNREIFGFASSL